MSIKVTINNENYNISCNTSIRQLELYQAQSVLDGRGKAGLQKICCIFLNAIVNRIKFYCYTQFHDEQYITEYKTLIKCIDTRNTYSAALRCEYREGKPIDIEGANRCFYRAMQERHNYIKNHATILYDDSDKIWAIMRDKNIE